MAGLRWYTRKHADQKARELMQSATWILPPMHAVHKALRRQWRLLVDVRVSQTGRPMPHLEVYIGLVRGATTGSDTMRCGKVPAGNALMQA